MGEIVILCFDFGSTCILHMTETGLCSKIENSYISFLSHLYPVSMAVKHDYDNCRLARR